MRLLVLGNLAKKFVDTFFRENETPLYKSSSGTVWTILRGAWSVFDYKAKTDTPASEYPLAVVNTTSADVDLSIKDLSQGAAAALWVSDSGNWWGVGVDMGSGFNCECSTCTVPVYSANSYFYDCGDITCQGANYYYCCNRSGNQNTVYVRNTCNRYFTSEGSSRCTGSWNAAYTYTNSGWCNNANTQCVGNYFTYKCGDNYCVGYYVWVSSYYTTPCDCTTCYPQYVRLFKYIAGVFSSVSESLISNTKIARSIKLFVRGNEITAKAYENVDLTSQISDDLVYTPTGVAINAKYGIMIKPSTYNQGNTLGEVEIEGK
jgi:hypothetical protein